MNFRIFSILSVLSFQFLYATPVDGTFTDSEARTLKFRYELPAGHNTSTPAPVLIFFHGNNSGTETEMLDMFMYTTTQSATSRGLIPIVVASPETRTDGVTRQWMDEDKLLIQEFLQSDIGGAFAVDKQKVYFAGASQGTCFLHDFMMVYGDNYGGGFYAGCGCYNSPDHSWNPLDNFKNDFKIYVHSTTEDFLHETSLKGYEYYRYQIGLNVRGDLYQSGDHCTKSWDAEEVALDWMTGKTTIPEDPFEPHWERFDPSLGVNGLAIDSTGKLLAGIQKGSNLSFIVRASSSTNWDTLWMGTDSLTNLKVSLDGTVLFNTASGLYSLESTGQATQIDNISASVFPDVRGNLFRDGTQWTEKSSDGGSNWNSFSNIYGDILDSKNNFFHQRTLSTGKLQMISGWAYENSSWVPKLLVSDDAGDNWNTRDIPVGTILSATQTGNTIYLLGVPSGAWSLEFWKSTDMGANWQRDNLPVDYDTTYSSNQDVVVLPSSKLMLYGGWDQHAWVRDASGGSWTRQPGFNGLTNAQIVQNPDGMLYASNGEGIYAWIATEGEEPVPVQRNSPLHSFSEEEFSIAQNSIEWRGTYPAHLKLLNMNGQVILAQTLHSGTVASLPSVNQAVFLNLSSENKHFSKLILLNH